MSWGAIAVVSFSAALAFIILLMLLGFFDDDRLDL